jgi:hypothetical protein
MNRKLQVLCGIAVVLLMTSLAQADSIKQISSPQNSILISSGAQDADVSQSFTNVPVTHRAKTFGGSAARAVLTGMENLFDANATSVAPVAPGKSSENLVALTPTPEPGTIMLMVGGMGLLGWKARKRARA